MNYILNYLNFNESKGISNSCELILYKIWKLIDNDINHIKDGTINIDIDEQDFKVKDLIINYIFSSPNPENLCNATSHLEKSVIDDGCLNNISIDLKIKINTIDDEFVYYIKSVLFHELLHIFQHYNIKNNNKFRPESFSIGSILPQIRPLIKSKYGNYILDVLYYSLSHEISSQLHQYYFYKKDGKDYKKINDIRNLLHNFKIKTLDNIEILEIEKIKSHILKAIKYYSNNKNYNKDIEMSLWNDNIVSFFNKMSDILKYKVKWIDNKVKIIDKKIHDEHINLNEYNIRYDITISLPSNWDEHENIEMFKIDEFIKEKLNDCKVIDGI
jgi:hypothetical protein